MDEKVLKPILILSLIIVFFGIMYLFTKNMPLSIIVGIMATLILK